MAGFRDKLKQAGVSYGCWITLASTLSAEVVGRAGFDWVILDTQHGGISEAQLLPLLQVFDATHTPALVRVNWLDPALIMRAADFGAAGVVVPMVNTADEARRAVEAVRYPPAGLRSFGPVRSYYSGEAAEEPLCLAMIETVEALRNLEAIAATPGLDGLLVGPMDLALSMGHPVSMQMPEGVLDAIGEVSRVCRERGLIAASVALGVENAAEQVRRGITFLSSGSDALFLKRAAGTELEQLRAIRRP